MDGDFNILAFAGSLRRASYNRGLVRAAREVAPTGVSVEVYDLDPIPLFNQDVEAQGDPPPVVDFKRRIAAADALLIATPEHSNSIPGVLKNALDWAVRPPGRSPMQEKPVAIMGAGPGRLGTANAQQALRAVFVFSESFAMLSPRLLVSGAHERFDSDGNLTDEDTRRRLGDVVEGLVQWAHRVGNGNA